MYIGWVATSGAFRTNLDLSGAEAGVYCLVMVANGRPSSLQLVNQLIRGVEHTVC